MKDSSAIGAEKNTLEAQGGSTPPLLHQNFYPKKLTYDML